MYNRNDQYQKSNIGREFIPERNEEILNISCSNCLYFDQFSKPSALYRNNSHCLTCILFKIHKTQNRISKISFDPNRYMPSSDYEIIEHLCNIYFKVFPQIVKLKQKLLDFNNNINDLRRKIPIIDNFCLDLDFFLNLLLFFRNENIDLNKVSQSELQRILKIKLSKKMYNALILIFSSKFASRINLLNYKIQDVPSLIQSLFTGPFSNEIFTNQKSNLQELKTIEHYNLFEYPMYEIQVGFVDHVKIYRYHTKSDKKTSKTYLSIKESTKNAIKSINYDSLMPLGEVLKELIRFSRDFLNKHYSNLNKYEIGNLALITALESIKFNRIFPLLVDNYIEEIYLDSPNSKIYLDHQRFGRCVTNIKLMDSEMESIKTFLRISSNKRLDITNPSIKCTLQNSFFNCRFTVDIQPIQPTGFSLDIRKMNKKVFTVANLIKRKMLSSKIASFLYFCILCRMNITVIGETSTGKTTLINALDLLVPRQLRKIYVEEAPESIDQHLYGVHQLKYLVDPDQHKITKSTKTAQIYTLLHRNPDLIYLGEILNREEAEALFHCLSAGLRGFQTIHARDIDSILNRWRYHFSIDPSCFNDLDILISLKRYHSSRIIDEIAEIQYINGKIQKNTIFKFNPNDFSWFECPNIGILSVFEKIILSDEERCGILNFFSAFEIFFNQLSKSENNNIEKTIRIFDQVYSIYRGSQSDCFINNWKKFEEAIILILKEEI